MKIAIPTENGKLCAHFGHAAQFAIVTVDSEKKQIGGVEYLTPPPHEPGSLPRWLHEQKVEVVIAGGMGGQAAQLLAQNKIAIRTGTPNGTPEELVKALFNNMLATGSAGCDHSQCNH